MSVQTSHDGSLFSWWNSEVPVPYGMDYLPMLWNALKITVDGNDVTRLLVTECRTGKNGYVEYYKTDDQGNYIVNGEDNLLTIEKTTGDVVVQWDLDAKTALV